LLPEKEKVAVIESIKKMGDEISKWRDGYCI
jgi:hypothetical protein